MRVECHDGQFLAWAAFSPASQIRARAWSFDEAQRIDAGVPAAAVARAVRARARFASPSDGVRLVHGESDGLPGLIVDRYGDTLVAQFLSAGVERWKALLADALLAATGLAKLYERSDAQRARAAKACRAATGWLRGEGPDRTHHPRARLAARRWTSPPATRPASTWTSATAARMFAEYGAAPALPARAELLLLHRRLHRGGAGRAARRT